MVVYQLNYRHSQIKTRVLHRNEAWKAAPRAALLLSLSPIPPPVITLIPTLPIPAAEIPACSRCKEGSYKYHQQRRASCSALECPEGRDGKC